MSLGHHLTLLDNPHLWAAVSPGASQGSSGGIPLSMARFGHWDAQKGGAGYREEASREFFCGLPELKVNVRGQKTAGGGGQRSQGLCSGFSGGGGGSKPGAPSSCFSLNGEVFLRRPWKS